MSCKLGFIGVGKMGGAILEGALSEKVLKPSEIGVYDSLPEQMKPYEEKGVTTFNSIEELVAGCSMILLAVKPQNFLEIMPEIKKTATESTLIISIAAGISAAQIKSSLGFDCKIILGMPNTPLLLGRGATALARVEPTSEQEFKEVREIFESVGVVEQLPEDKLNEAIPVNGSSPAFIYLMAKTIVDHAETVGIERESAMNLFTQTLIGSAEMLRSSGFTADELIEMVCSPGGTTIEGMRALEENGFEKSLNLAFEACVTRAEELSGLGKVPEQDVTLRIISIEDDCYPEIVKLREEVLRAPIGLELTDKDKEKDHEAVHFVACKGEKIIGTAQLLRLDAFNAQMRQMAVLPDSQKAGVGRLLIKAVEDYAKEQEFSRITMNARQTAQGFYSALGYECRGNLFTEKGLPHISMYKDLDDEVSESL